MKETSSIKTTASAPLKQNVQPSVTMLKKKKKKRKKKRKKGGETQQISYQCKRIPHCLEFSKSDRKINSYMKLEAQLELKMVTILLFWSRH